MDKLKNEKWRAIGLTLLALVLAMVWFLMNYQPPVTETKAELNSQARQIIKQFRQQFRPIIKKGFRIGPDYAVHMFQENMLNIMNNVVKRHKGWKFRRVSLHPLNPNSKAKGWEKEALQNIVTRKEQGEKLKHLTYSKVSGSKFRYLKPQILNASCVKCHSNRKTDEVRHALKVRYKKVNIKDYQYGEVIGAYSLEKTVARPFYEMMLP